MTRKRILEGAAVLVFAATILQSLVAHHSFAAEYDVDKPVTLTGTVTRLEWTNPHARLYLDVKDGKGAVTNWELELGSVNMLVRYQFTRNSVRIGETLTVEGFSAKDGSNLANAKTIRFSDGRALNAGSSSSSLGDTK